MLRSETSVSRHLINTSRQCSPWKLAKQYSMRQAQVSRRFSTLPPNPSASSPPCSIRLLPYATASVWRQLGLGDIEEAARNGELKDLKWGGLKPGTKLGPLAPIFPRADKGLAQIMTDMESLTHAQTTRTRKHPRMPSLEALNAVHPEASSSPRHRNPQPQNLEPRT